MGGILSKQEKMMQLLAHIVLSIMVILVIIPFWLLIAASFSDSSYAIAEGYHFIPGKLSLDAYRFIVKLGVDPPESFTEWLYCGPGQKLFPEQHSRRAFRGDADRWGRALLHLCQADHAPVHADFGNSRADGGGILLE